MKKAGCSVVEIKKILKKDIKELENENLKHIFRRYTWKGDNHPYKIDLCMDAAGNDSVHVVSCRKIQYKTATGANKLINELNKDFNAKLKPF